MRHRGITGGAELDFLGDPGAACVGELLETLDAHAGPIGRLPELNLLFYDAKPTGEALLSNPGRDPGFDDRLGEVVDGAKGALLDPAGVQAIVFPQLALNHAASPAVERRPTLGRSWHAPLEAAVPPRARATDASNSSMLPSSSCAGVRS